VRQAGRQRDKQTDRQAGRHAGRQTDKQTGRQTDRETNRQKDRQTERQARSSDECKQHVTMINPARSFIATVSIIKLTACCYKACFCIQCLSSQRMFSILNCDLQNSIRLSSLLNIKHASGTIIFCRSSLKTHLFRKTPDMSCAPCRYATKEGC